MQNDGRSRLPVSAGTLIPLTAFLGHLSDQNHGSCFRDNRRELFVKRPTDESLFLFLASDEESQNELWT